MVEHTVLNMKDYKGIKVALVDRGTGFQPYVVAWCYDEDSRTWGQGHYFQKLKDAVKYYEKNYKTGMVKQWFTMIVGWDVGGPESGPIWRSTEEYFKARSLEKAKERAERMMDKYGNGSEGYSVHEATYEELTRVEEAQRWWIIEGKYDPEELPFN